MKTPLMALAGFTTGPSSSAIRYSPTYGGLQVTNWSSAVNSVGTPFPVAGNLSQLRVRFPTTGAGSYIVTIMVNGVASAVTCMPNTAATGIASDLINSVAIAAGDLVAIRVDPNGTTPTVQTIVQVGMLFTATTSGESFVVGGYVGGLSAGGTFLSFGANDGDTTASASSQVWPTAGVLDHLYFRVSVAPGAAASGKSRTLEIFKNGVATGVTCTILETAVIASDLTHSVSVAAGDLISVQETNANTPATTLFGFGARFVPTINGESVQLARWSAAPTAGADRFNNANGSANGAQATEANCLNVAPVDFVAKKLYASVVTGPGGTTRTRQTWLRQGTGGGQTSTALTATITDTATAANDGVNTVNVTAADLLNFQVTSSASSTATTQMRTSFVSYIAPPVGASVSQLTLLGAG